MSRRQNGVRSSAMAFSARCRKARILLLAALSLPAWELGHVLLHEHLANHHGVHRHADAAPRHGQPEFDTGTRQAREFCLVSDDGAHEHRHLEGVLVPVSRSDDAPKRFARLSASPDPVPVTPRVTGVAWERAPTRAGRDASDPSHPRAPPYA